MRLARRASASKSNRHSPFSRASGTGTTWPPAIRIAGSVLAYSGSKSSTSSPGPTRIRNVLSMTCWAPIVISTSSSGSGVHAVLALELPRDRLAEVLVPLDAGIVRVLVDRGARRVPDEVGRQAVADRPAGQAHDVAELLREVAQVARGRHGARQVAVRVVEHQGGLHAAGQPPGGGGLGQTGLARLSLALLHGHSPRCSGRVSFTPGWPPGPAGRPRPAARRPARHGTGRRRSGSGRAAARGAAARTAPRASRRAARAGSG